MQHHRSVSLENIVEEIDGIVYVEEWRPIKGFEGIYEISSFGRVKKLAHTLKNGKQRPDTIRLAGAGKKKKYLKVTLSHNGKKVGDSIHRLVGLHFIPLVEGKPHINHTHGIKTHNHYSKLEWCTPQENNEHGVRMGLLKRGVNKKPYIKKGRSHIPKRYKKVVDITTGDIYNSAEEVSKLTGISLRSLRRQISGERYNHTNYRYVGKEHIVKEKPVVERPVIPIGVFDLQGNNVRDFYHPQDVAAFCKCEVADINSFLNGKRSFVKGYTFKMIDEDSKYIEPTPFVSKKLPPKPKRIPKPVTPSKEIIKLNIDGKELQRFGSIGEAAKHAGAEKGNFRKVIKGKLKGRPGYYKGFFYRYADHFHKCE